MNTLLYDNEDDTDRSVGGTRLKERPMLIVRVSDDDQLRLIYDFGDELGRGRYGVVVQVRARLTRMCWAVKVINKNQAKYPGIKLVDREIRILRLITHPNIIHLEKVYETPKKLYLVFELCSSTLAREFSERRPFSEPDTREVIRKLAGAVAYLHRNGIVHRDLKLENILLTTNPADPDDKLFIKVTDFGQSVVRSGVAHDQMLHERCGTMAYMAPEVLESRMYSHQCDVWSMGVIAYVLLVGDFPFTADNPEQFKQRVLNDEPQFQSPFPCAATNITPPLHSATEISDEAKAVVLSMLTKKPEFRISAAELCVHSWLVEDRSFGPSMNAIELMNSMMETDEARDQHTSRVTTRESSLSAAGSISTHQSEDDFRRRSVKTMENETTPTHPQSKKASAMPHSDPDVETVVRGRSAKPRKVTITRPANQPPHLASSPPPPNAVTPVLTITDGRNQSFSSPLVDRQQSGDRKKK